MGNFAKSIKPRTAQFISRQNVFFVATAPEEGRINLSPKGMDTFRVVNENRVMWLSVTGSGNETAAHLAENGRITVMFCAFEGTPNILRLYGRAVAVYPHDSEWNQLAAQFPSFKGARQIFNMKVESVQNSCGMSIPFYTYQGERNDLIKWTEKKSEQEIEEYWDNRNAKSIDGKPTK